MLPGKVGKTGLLGQTHRWDPGRHQQIRFIKRRRDTRAGLLDSCIYEMPLSW